jgi:hypothetical protein
VFLIEVSPGCLIGTALLPSDSTRILKYPVYFHLYNAKHHMLFFSFNIMNTFIKTYIDSFE